MFLNAKNIGAVALRLLVALSPISWLQTSSAAGTWSVIAAAAPGPGQLSSPGALATDPAGNLYVVDFPVPDRRGRIRKRDAQGNWFVIAQQYASALTADASGNLYVAELGRIGMRESRGNWSVLATLGTAPGQVSDPRALAVDAAGNLYVAEWSNDRIQERDSRGHWSVIAPKGTALS